MQAGKLRHRITIQRLNPNAIARDDHGGIIEEWLRYADTWASIEPIRAVEIFRAQQVDTRITHRILLRHISGITADMRIQFGTRYFLLLSVVNPEERREMLEMLAVEAAM